MLQHQAFEGAAVGSSRQSASSAHAVARKARRASVRGQNQPIALAVLVALDQHVVEIAALSATAWLAGSVQGVVVQITTIDGRRAQAPGS